MIHKFHQKILIILIFYLLFFPHLFICWAANSFQTGWWTTRNYNNPSLLNTYAEQKNTLVLLYGEFCGANQISTTFAYLDEAQKTGIKAIVGLTCSENTSYPISPSEFTSIINQLKNYPALYAYYIADEPEWSSDLNIMNQHHTYLASNPGYYSLVKSADPTHPVMISFNMYFNQTQRDRIKIFYDVTDIVGIHAYPFAAADAEFTGYNTTMYDVWKGARNDALQAGKTDFIATCQGFGDNTDPYYRNPTDNELRWQIFSAIVQGIDKVMFWMDDWAKTSGMTDQITRMISQIQEIGAEMNSGITDDNRIGVSVTNRNQLTYRYGINGERGIILAVNIANRDSGGTGLANVKFNLPSDIQPIQVDVLDENRTLPVNNGSFIDSFSKFQVHVYAFSNLTSIETPTPTTNPCLLSKQGDINCSGKVNALDLSILLGAFGSTSVNNPSDLNSSGKVNALDMSILLSNFGRSQ